MRQIFLILSIMLLGLTWAVAQDSTGAPSSRAGQSASGQTTVEGCLSGSNGNFTLTDKHGTTYQLTGDTATLTEHVGHEVKVTGTSSSGAGGSESASAGAGSSQTLQVSSVKHVSKTCKSGGGMAH
jgi:uncharacterized protein DUF5818